MNRTFTLGKTGGLAAHEYVLITDIGSTTTKALLIKTTPGGTLLEKSVCVPTTVEKPREDVRIGVLAAVAELEKRAGIRLTNESGEFTIPYLTTSSAGGGLQILVFGLTSVETGRVAEVAAYGAGGVILGTMTIDDEIAAVDKMRLMRDLHPDLILMAGGFNGGAIANVVNLAELLTLADPQPKFRQNMKIPLVFCGNVEAREFVKNVLEDTFDVYVVDNVRPSGMEVNLGPAKDRVLRLFMDNVMERAPGYPDLKKMTSADIIPTPAAVENILRLYGGTLSENVLMMDMGGATTDIFSNILGKYHRTVAANIGMSYSMSNVLEQCGIESVMSHLPESFDDSEVRDYIANKTLYPTYVPESEEEAWIEHALAIEGTEIAWNHHLDINFKTARLGFLDRLKARAGNICKFEQLFLTEEEEPFTLSDIGTIIGAGGIIASAGTLDAIRILLEGFRPYGITRLMVDRDFLSPHMGVLATVDPDSALRLFMEECLEEIGYVVAPFGNVRENKPALEIRDIKSGETRILNGGQYLFFESGGNFEFTPRENISLGKQGEAYRLETDLPVLIDACGRGDKAVDIPLTKSLIPQFSRSGNPFTSGIRPGETVIEKGEFEVESRLPYEGTILVSRGDSVEPGDLLGENRYAPPRIYILDLNRITGYDRHLTPEELSKGLLVWTGDVVSIGQPLFKVHRQGVAGFDFKYSSPVRGRITRIEQSGLLILREVQDYDGLPHEIDVAGQLGIRPARIRGYLNFRPGDFIGAEQAIARDVAKGIFVKSPTSGILKNVDTKKGTVTVQYDVRPVPLKSYVSGTVKQVRENRSVLIGGSGSRIEGKIGFGGQNFGILAVLHDMERKSLSSGSVVATREPIDRDFLERAVESGVKGIIAPSISNTDWVSFYGRELGVALTGDESIPFTVLLTRGFGSFEMDEGTWSFLEKCQGRVASLSGRTQIRAGVTRPHVIICD